MDAERDANRVPTLIGVPSDDVDGDETITIAVNPSTNAVIVEVVD